MSRFPEDEGTGYEIEEKNSLYETKPHSSTKRYRYTPSANAKNTRPEGSSSIPPRKSASRPGREKQSPLTTRQPVKHLVPRGGLHTTRNAQESTELAANQRARREIKTPKGVLGRLALTALAIGGIGLGSYEIYVYHQANQNNTIPIYGTPGITTFDTPPVTATSIEMNLNNFSQTTFDGMTGYTIPLDKQKISEEQGYQTITCEIKVQKEQTFALALAGGYQQVGVVGGDIQQLQEAMQNTWFPQEDRPTDPIIPDIVIISNDTDHELNYAWAVRLKSGGDWDNTQVHAWLFNNSTPSKIGPKGSLIPAIESIQTSENLTPFDPSDGINIVDQPASTLMN